MLGGERGRIINLHVGIRRRATILVLRMGLQVLQANAPVKKNKLIRIMTNSLTLNKVAAALVGVAMVAGVAFAFTATRAHAVTLSELVELFIALEVIPADKADEARTVLQGQGEETTTPSTPAATVSCNFTRNLTVGATGADVMELQKLLNSKGYTVATAGAGSAGMESQYFGPATKAAVAKMQEAFAAEILTPLGLTTGTGYFGASTRAKANTLCATTPEVPEVPGDDDDDDTTPGDDDDDDNTLSGGEASLGDLTRASTPSSVEVSEGDEEVQVAGFKFDVDDADASLKRVYVSFEETSAATNSVDPWDYFESVQIYVNDEMVAEEAADDEDNWEDISGSNRYEMRFTGLDEFLAADEEAEITVGVTMLNNVDGDDEDAVWSVTVPANGVRVTDGEGIDSTTPAAIATARTFSLEAAGTDDELKIKTASSNPDSSVVKVDENDDTQDVTVLVMTLEAEGSDIEIREFPVLLTTSDNNIDDVVADVTFEVDGKVLGEMSSSDVGTTTTFEFDNDEFVISKDDSVTVKVIVDLKDSSDYAEGTTLEADVDATRRQAIVAEGTDDLDANSTNDISGTADGEVHQLLSEGIFAEVKSTDKSLVNEDTASADKATFEIVFDVTAFEEDFYVPFSATTTLGAGVRAGALFLVETDAGAQATTTGTTTYGLTNTSGAETSSNHWIIRDGDTETFELSVTYNPAANGTYRAQLTGVYYATGTAATLQLHTAAPAEDFETGTVQVTDN